MMWCTNLALMALYHLAFFIITVVKVVRHTYLPVLVSLPARFLSCLETVASSGSRSTVNPVVIQSGHAACVLSLSNIVQVTPIVESPQG